MSESNGYYSRPLIQRKLPGVFLKYELVLTKECFEVKAMAREFLTGAEMQLISHIMQRWIDRIAVLPVFIYRLIIAIIQMFQDSRFVHHTSGKLRRLALVHCKKKYVHRQLSSRRGTCRQCGTCCNLLFTCPMLTKHGHCLVYGTCRPQACKVFPIDQRDIDEVKLCNGQCGFYFGGEDSDKGAVNQQT